jgi:long-chain acyl-CoA synthetase
MERIWHKSYARGVSLKLNFDSTSLPEALSRSAIRFPDNPALYFQGTTVTFKDLDSMVSRFAAALTSKGLVKGTRVGIILPNLIQTVVGIYGILRAGGIVVPLNPRSDDMQLEHQLKLAGVEMVICLDVLVPRILELRKKTSVRLVVSCHIRDYLPFMKRHLFPIFKRELHLKTPESAGVLEFTYM